MDSSLPDAKSITVPNAREPLRRIVVERNLCGLANDTKWDVSTGFFQQAANRDPQGSAYSQF